MVGSLGIEIYLIGVPSLTFNSQKTEAHHTQAPNVTIGTFGEMLKANTSVNFYMYHGGTNFGFMNGANSDPKDDTLTNFAYQPITTSYDYDGMTLSVLCVLDGNTLFSSHF